MTYQAYVLPRIQALSGRAWIAVVVVSFWWALQHSFLPFIADFAAGPMALRCVRAWSCCLYTDLPAHSKTRSPDFGSLVDGHYSSRDDDPTLK